MAYRAFSVGLVCSTLALLVGCGKAESDAGPVSSEAFPEAVAKLICDSLGGCCQTGNFPFNAATCKSERSAEIQDDLQRVLASGRVDYDANAAGECLAAAASVIQCGDVRLNEESEEACANVMRGRVAPGQPCEDDTECRRGAGEEVDCQFSDARGDSVCVVRNAADQPPRGKTGDPCDSTCDDRDGGTCLSSAPVTRPAPGPGPAPAPPPTPFTCFKSDNLYCAYEPATGTQSCRTTVGEGGSCEYGESCGAGTSCDYSVVTCTAPKPNGSPCDSDSSCRSNFCEQNSQLCADVSVSADDCQSF